MTSRTPRKRPSFWLALTVYLHSELKAVLHTLALCAAIAFFLISLVVGMYQVVRWIVLLVMFG